MVSAYRTYLFRREICKALKRGTLGNYQRPSSLYLFTVMKWHRIPLSATIAGQQLAFPTRKSDRGDCELNQHSPIDIFVA